MKRKINLNALNNQLKLNHRIKVLKVKEETNSLFRKQYQVLGLNKELITMKPWIIIKNQSFRRFS